MWRPDAGSQRTCRHLGIEIDVGGLFDPAVVGVDRDLLEELAPIVHRREDAAGCEELAQVDLFDGAYDRALGCLSTWSR
ncbi:MAG: hypothetical protein ACXVUL_22565 [Solirubrobacteraceae bacterium]